MGNTVACTLSSAALATEVEKIIGGSGIYTSDIIENGVSGELIGHTTEMIELQEIFEELNVNHIHRRQILLHFMPDVSPRASGSQPLPSLQVAEEVKALGKNYEGYGELIISKDISSDIIAFDEGSTEANASFYHEIGIRSKLHIKAISRHFMPYAKSLSDDNANKAFNDSGDDRNGEAMEVVNSNESNEIGPEIGMGGGSQDIVQAEEDNEGDKEGDNKSMQEEDKKQKEDDNKLVGVVSEKATAAINDDKSTKEEGEEHDVTPTKPINSRPSYPSPRSSTRKDLSTESSSSSSSSSSAAAAGVRDPNDVCPETAVLLASGITLPPCEIFKRLFQLQSIDMDPRNIEECLNSVVNSTAPPMSTISSKPTPETSSSFSESSLRSKGRTNWSVTRASIVKEIPSAPPTRKREFEYDYFISYRVKSELDVVEKSYYFLTSKGYKVYWDKKCLKKGQDWKEGFIHGIKKSKYFLPFISKAGIATKPNNCKDFLRDHSMDNVLIEYETALHIARNTRDTSFICPIVVGCYRKLTNKEDDTVTVEEGLIKYRDFDASKFSMSIKFDLNLHKNQMMEWFTENVTSVTDKKAFLALINCASENKIYTIKGIWEELSKEEENIFDVIDIDGSLEDIEEIKVKMELEFGSFERNDEEEEHDDDDDDDDEGEDCEDEMDDELEAEVEEKNSGNSEQQQEERNAEALVAGDADAEAKVEYTEYIRDGTEDS